MSTDAPTPVVALSPSPSTGAVVGSVVMGIIYGFVAQLIAYFALSLFADMLSKNATSIPMFVFTAIGVLQVVAVLGLLPVCVYLKVRHEYKLAARKYAKAQQA